MTDRGMNNRRKLLLALSAGAFAPLLSHSQAQARTWRVGFLAQRGRPSAIDSDIYGAFVRGMRELGYVEGKNLAIEWKFAGDKIERLPALAKELVASKPDLIVAGATPSVQAAHRATMQIPIVFV